MKGLAVIFIGVVLSIAGCGGRQAGTPGSTPSSEQEILVKMGEFKYEPNALEVKAGKVKFKLENTGTVEHSFVIVGTGKGVAAVRPGVIEELEVELKPGTYKVDCDVAGHKEAGMTMTLIVK